MDKSSQKEHLEDLVEEIVMEYAKSFDLDVAMMICEVTPEEKAILIKDKDLLFRLEYHDAKIRAKIIDTMIKNMDLAKGPLSQKAAVDLGNILYKEKFSKKELDIKLTVPDTITLVGVQE